MRICFVYNEKAYGQHRKPLDFSDVEAMSLTGSDLAFVKHAEHLRQRGHEVVCYVPRVLAHASPEGLLVRCVDHLPEDLKVEHFDVAVALSNPDDLRHFPETTYRTVNRQCGPFGNDVLPDWQDWTDLVTCPSCDAKDRVGAGIHVPVNVVPNGCDPASYDQAVLPVPGRVVYLSAPDRGLHILLQAWPTIKRLAPEAHLRIFYYALPEYLAQHARPDQVRGEDARRAHYVKHALERLKHLGVEAVGGVSHRDLAREMLEAQVFAFPCDTSSYTETFSVATLEACAAGCVPVISSADSLGELYGEMLPETVVPAPVREHVGQFADLVALGIINQNFRERVTSRARAIAHDKFDWKKLSHHYENVLSWGVLAKHSAPADRVAQFEHHTSEMGDVERGAWAKLGEELGRDGAWVLTTEEHVTAAETSIDPEVFLEAEKPIPRPEEKCVPKWAQDVLVMPVDTCPVCKNPRAGLVTNAVGYCYCEDHQAKIRVTGGDRKLVVHLALSSYSSGNVPIDLDDPFYESEGGGCRGGFMGLARAFGELGKYRVRAFSTFKRGGTRGHVEYLDVDRSSLTVGKPDAVLAYYDCRPLVHVENCLRIASHHTFNLGGWAGALEWADVNVAPCQYVVDALRRVYDTEGVWHVLPNASVEIDRVCERVPGRVIYHTSASRGLHHLVSMWPSIKRRAPHATLHVVGGALQWCEALRGRTGRSGHRANQILRDLPAAKSVGGIEFTGFLPRRELVRELCEAEVFAFPSTTVAPSETFSVSILECLKLGVAVVLSPCDALKSVWGGAVRMTPAPVEENLAAFEDAVVDRLNRPDYDGMVEVGRLAAAGYTFKAAAEKLDQIVQHHVRGVPMPASVNTYAGFAGYSPAANGHGVVTAT